MQSQELDEVAAVLTGMGSAGASSQDVAEAAAAAFLGIDRVLTPIFGKAGAAALYQRSRHLTSQTHPWLLVMPGPSTEMDVAALTTCLSKQTATEAAAASTQLLQKFHEVLIGLIGASLTERLLRPVWTTFLSVRPTGSITQWRTE